MTIMDAISRIDSLKPNRYEQVEKVKWLGTLEKRLVDEIFSRYELKSEEKEAVENFTVYNENTPVTTELLAKAPYDELYIHWIEAQINYWNGEYPKYNNSIDMFEEEYKAYRNQFNRTHKPKGTKFKFF